jgi:tetratricopeptide (TPR) repeat protein
MGRRAITVSVLAALACSRGPVRPAVVEGPVTTDGILARSNLQSMIAAHEGMVSREPGWGSARLSLVTLLLARASTYGRVEDLERAQVVAEDGVNRAPRSPEAWLARAAGRAGVHRFGEASGDLDRALALGAEGDAVAAQRASIALARGEFTAALDVARARATREPGMATSSALGVVLAESGDGAGAAQELARALAAYRDTSPFPVAFVEFRQGLLAERAGDLRRATERYAAVLRRLPGHAQAAVHLASVQLALGSMEAAADALSSVLPEASDPEIEAIRAELARRRGETAEASRHEAEARARYLVLLGLHPEAFADHAARFFLDRDPSEAVRWATRNLEVRQTPDGFDLALTAALRAHDGHARCALARRAAVLGVRPARLAILIADGLASCPPASAAQVSASR